MPDVLDQARKAIEAGLREFDHEAGRLRNALANLGGGTPAGNRRPTTKRRSTTRRAPRGQRQEQFLAAVKKNPGAPVSQIAKEMGVQPSQAYTLAHRLHQKGEIRKRGKGYAVQS
jgi:predicted Rossmann fold nucleotide-binding protein DprA/Smf involved in DNA uptake